MKTKRTPRFKSESEEADWWASRAGRQYVKQKSAQARKFARRKGIGYQTLLKMLMREGLEREGRRG